MKINLEKTGRHVFQMIQKIGALADRKGLRVFVIGGGVRDFFLKRSVNDVDVVLEADAVDFAKKFSGQTGLPLTIHKRFGTATIGKEGLVPVDFVTARKEVYPSPGALPKVSPASLAEDVFRRDFTINALAVSINRQDFGLVVDLCRGLEDLEKGRIRIFHEKSFVDDPTRILRAVRFEQRFQFRFSRDARRLLTRAIAGKAYTTVSSPRYFQEFARGFFEDAPRKYLLRLKVLGALGFLGEDIFVEKNVLNFLDRLKGAEKEGLGKASPVIYLSVIYAHSDVAEIRDWAKIFQWPRGQTREIIKCVQALQQMGFPVKGKRQNCQDVLCKIFYR